MKKCKICYDIPVLDAPVCTECGERAEKCPNCGKNTITERNGREVCVDCGLSLPEHAFTSDLPVWDEMDNSFVYYDKTRKKMFLDIDFSFDGKYLMFTDIENGKIYEYKFTFQLIKRI